MENDVLLYEVYGENEFNAKYDFEFNYLVQKNVCLIDCSYEKKNKKIYFNYHLNDCNNIQKLLKKDTVLFLLNLIYFLPYYQEYCINFNVENIYFDFNFVPKFLKRDVMYTSKSYFEDIKTLCLYLLDKKEEFTYYQSSGLFKKYEKKLLNEIKNCVLIEDLFNILKNEKIYN